MGTLTKTVGELNQIFDNSGDTDLNYRFKDGVLQLKNVTDGKFHTIWLETSLGKAKMKHAITGEV